MDIKITIKNIPDDNSYDSVIQDSVDKLRIEYGIVAEKTTDLVIDYNKLALIHPKAIIEILGNAIPFHYILIGESLSNEK